MVDQASGVCGINAAVFVTKDFKIEQELAIIHRRLMEVRPVNIGEHL